MNRVGGTAPLSAAATAAASRAGDCRRRADDLRCGSGSIGAVEVDRARARLAQAEARAAAAQQRLEETRRHHEVQQMLRRFHLGGSARAMRVPRHLDDDALTPIRLKTFDWVSSGAVGLKPLWLAFIALGGECGLLELDAYLHGAWEMAPRDLSVLEQVCWEYETFGTL